MASCKGQQALALEGVALVLAVLLALMLESLTLTAADQPFPVHSQHGRRAGAEQDADEAIQRLSSHR